MKSVVLFLVINSIYLNAAFGWHDETHLAIAKAAGYWKWYNAAGADITKIKAGRIESNNHGFYSRKNDEITSEMVLSQVDKYNDPTHMEGHLYGAILASLREYKKSIQVGKYSEYHIAFCAHYVGDLSQPFHNISFDDFNKEHHAINDGIVENEVLQNMRLIEKNMYVVHLSPRRFEKDLSREIARVANLSRSLGQKLKTENRDLTKEEAYLQLGHSASLLKGILKCLGKL